MVCPRQSRHGLLPVGDEAEVPGSQGADCVLIVMSSAVEALRSNAATKPRHLHDRYTGFVHLVMSSAVKALRSNAATQPRHLDAGYTRIVGRNGWIATG